MRKNIFLEIGDYYCSDGSLIKPADLTDTNRKNIIGVVYWVGNAQPSVLYAEEISEEIDVLKADFPNCVHGLVYTVDIANESAKMLFVSLIQRKIFFQLILNLSV